MEPVHVAGLLLTGGSSSRMGRDKASVEVGGVPLALRVARALQDVAYPVLAVGREVGTGLDTVQDPRKGPLVAFAYGTRALRVRGYVGPIMLLACDLPFVEPEVLARIAASLGSYDAAVPTIDGEDQPLAACYSAAGAGFATWMVADGARAMWQLLDVIPTVRVPEVEWAQGVGVDSLRDVDTPESLEEVRRILDEPQ